MSIGDSSPLWAIAKLAEADVEREDEGAEKCMLESKLKLVLF